MGHALNIYDDATLHNMHIVRKIRNAFAHSRKLLNFDHPLIVAEIASTKISKKSTKRSVARQLDEIRRGENTPLTSYVLLCYALFIVLIHRRSETLKDTHRKRKSRLAKRQAAVQRATNFAGGIFSTQQQSPFRGIATALEQYRIADQSNQSRPLGMLGAFSFSGGTDDSSKK